VVTAACPQDAALVAELRAEVAVLKAMVADLQQHSRLQDTAIDLLKAEVTDGMRAHIRSAGALT
jgi:hypothetical protein